MPYSTRSQGVSVRVRTGSALSCKRGRKCRWGPGHPRDRRPSRGWDGSATADASGDQGAAAGSTGDPPRPHRRARRGRAGRRRVVRQGTVHVGRADRLAERDPRRRSPSDDDARPQHDPVDHAVGDHGGDRDAGGRPDRQGRRVVPGEVGPAVSGARRRLPLALAVGPSPQDHERPPGREAHPGRGQGCLARDHGEGRRQHRRLPRRRQGPGRPPRTPARSPPGRPGPMRTRFVAARPR